MDSNTGPDAPLPGRDRALLRRGRMLEGITLGWNAAGIVVLATGYHPGPSLLGIIWTAATAAAMFALARLWWADPLAALVIVSYALREAREIFLPGLLAPGGMAKARETP